MDKLGALFKTDRVVCHGGGTINGTFLAQGVVDSLSLILVPVVSGDPTDIQLFNSMDGGKLPVTDFDLDSVGRLERGGPWLRYLRRAWGGGRHPSPPPPTPPTKRNITVPPYSLRRASVHPPKKKKSAGTHEEN